MDSYDTDDAELERRRLYVRGSGRPPRRVPFIPRQERKPWTPKRYVDGHYPMIEAWTKWPLSPDEILLIRCSKDSRVVG